MTEFTISCDAFVRLSKVLHNFADDVDPVFKTIRFDSGQAVATNRSFMAIENIGGHSGIAHVIVDPALLAQATTEIAFGSKMTIIVNEPLQFTIAKTTLGYTSGNIGYFPGATDFDRWRSIVEQARVPATTAYGGMFWDASQVAMLAASSPSGMIVFEELINCARPTLMRDTQDYNWLGVFNPFQVQHSYSPATIPNWIV